MSKCAYGRGRDLLVQMVKGFAYANVQRCLRQGKRFDCANGEKICYANVQMCLRQEKGFVSQMSKSLTSSKRKSICGKENVTREQRNVG